MRGPSGVMNQRIALDTRVLNHLRSVQGSTAWAMCGSVGATREDVSKACQRLKRKGLVKTSETQTTYWQAVKPAAKPQGEPVAWMQPGQGGMCISNEVKLHSLKMAGAPASAVSGYSVPLYAGQPAPVAAVPEGWQMVPVAPTDDMIVAFAEAWYSKHQTIDDPSMLEAYHDMLVVAPTYPRQQ